VLDDVDSELAEKLFGDAYSSHDTLVAEVCGSQTAGAGLAKLSGNCGQPQPVAPPNRPVGEEFLRRAKEAPPPPPEKKKAKKKKKKKKKKKETSADKSEL